ncbi:MAG: hypothetical protein GX874_13960, partial [Smithella sp.]|nr:hypothetical protein [Smithella sp.]
MFKKSVNLSKITEYSFLLRNGSQWDLTVEKLSEYETTFSDIDIHRELRKARQWLIDNPTKRKTATGMPRFLSGWLGGCKPTPAESTGEYI